MSVDIKLKFDHETIIEYSRQSGEPDWMLKLRLQGFEKYQGLPFPKLEKTKIDKWNIDRFTPFQSRESVSNIDELPDIVRALLAESEEKERAILIQHDASVVFTSLPEEWKKQGVVFGSLQDALKTHGDLIQKYFMQLGSKVDSHKLSALHTAVWSGGVFLYVPKNVEVKTPIQSVFYATEQDSGMAPHVLIIAEPNSSVEYIDVYLNTENTAFVQNGMTEIHVGEGAKVRFASARQYTEQAIDYMYRHATVERDGRMEWILGEMNNGSTITRNSTHLKGNGSSVDSKLVTVGSGNQKENVETYVVHTGQDTDSQVLMKGVVTDEATAIINGITFIEKGATRSDGKQSEKVLMLSPKARGDANPMLLIDEDDVMAAHAASIGQIDPLQIYYLMSRGITKSDAQRLIINGFLAPVVNGMKQEGIKKLLEKAIERKVY